MRETKINTKRGFLKTMRMLTYKYKDRMFYCMNIFLLVFAISVSFVHLIQFTGAASEGFVIKQLNQKLNELKSQNKELNLQSAKLQSIDEIKKRSDNLGMIASEGFDYITLKSGPLSLK